MGTVVRLALSAIALLGADLVLASAEPSRVTPVTVPLCQRPFSLGEWGTDALVEVTLSRPPAVGQTATLLVELCAKQTGAMQVDIVLPAGFGWVVLPPQFTAADRVSPDPANFGCLPAAHGTLVLAALTPLRLTASVAAHTPGPAIVTATAKPATGPGDTSYAYLTVGRTPRSSYFGFRDESDTGGTATTAPPGGVLTPHC